MTDTPAPPAATSAHVDVSLDVGTVEFPVFSIGSAGMTTGAVTRRRAGAQLASGAFG